MTEEMALDSPREGGRVLRVTAHPCSLRAVRDHVRCHAAALGAPEPWIADLVLAVDEACQNIIRHGYGHGCGGPDDAAGPDCAIVVETAAHPSEERPEALVVRLTDFAGPVDAAKIRARDLEDLRPGGLGVHFIHALTDECAWVEPPAGAGNVLRLVKRLPPAADSGEGERP